MENKEELKKKIKEIMASTSRVQEHIDSFDNCFESEVSKRTNKKVLEELFYEFIDLAYKNTTLYKFMINNMADIDEKLRLTLTPEQKELVEAYYFLSTTISDDFGLQSFIYGYALGQQLQIESNIAMNELLPDLKNKLHKDSELL